MPQFNFYKLVRDNECIYVGVTGLLDIRLRFNCHKSDYTQYLKGKHRRMCYYTEDFSFDGVSIELIEIGEYQSLRDTRKRENELIQEFGPEYQKANKLENPNYQKEYRETNKERLKEQKAKYFQEVLKVKGKTKYQCEKCYLVVSLSNKSRHNSRCDPETNLYDEGYGWRFRICGKNPHNKSFKTREEAMEYKKNFFADRLNK